MDDDSEVTTEPDSDGDGNPNYLDIDSDNDGIFDVDEGGDGALDTNGDGRIDSTDDGYTDLDGDGMDDDSEVTTEPDSDGDGNLDYLDIDSDNDGIFDVVEGGDGALDTNGDGVINFGDDGYSDSDGDGMDDDSEITPITNTDNDSLPDYLDVDSDNDGIQDVIEGGDGALDTNNDGVIDATDDGYSDADGDGMDDDSEITPVTETDGDTLPDYQDIDSDNDGIQDVIEGGDGALDTNGDGVIDTNDDGYSDADGDGMSDDSEITPPLNSDGDANPDYIDVDSDNDGIYDVTESGDGSLDPNGDGAIDSNDNGYVDSDGDGMDDNSEITSQIDNDGDSLPNHLDLDSDNDGIYDIEEGGDGDLDTNADGVVDINDDGFEDADGDGMDDDAESTPSTNTDNDALPDFIDIDSDNDGIQDVIEGGDGLLDTNGDGVLDSIDDGFEDADGDGMADASEDTPVLDNDLDGVDDYQDLDSDNDGIFDVYEGGDGDGDTNGDGMIDSLDDGYVDSDNDGMSDVSELSDQPDTDYDSLSVDNDTIPDYLDLDSDDDGCYDVVEAGFVDEDGDGILGVGVPVVNNLGQVVTDGDDGYNDPIDADGNGVIDCLDALTLTVTLDSYPYNFNNPDQDGNGVTDTITTMLQGDALIISIDVSSEGDGLEVVYQWQISTDQGLTWYNISESGLTDIEGATTSQLSISKLTVDDYDETMFRVLVTAPGYYCATVISGKIELDVKYKELHIPTGFSPDDNNQANDLWVIRGVREYPNNTVHIYNRWEVKVYEKQGYNNTWDGTSNTGFVDDNTPLPEGVYFFVFEYGDGVIIDGKEYVKGYVYIRRKE